MGGRRDAVAFEERSIETHMQRLTGLNVSSSPSSRMTRMATVGSLTSSSRGSGTSGVSPDKQLFVFSGCQDNQTSADAMIGGKRQGAFTWAFTKALTDMKFRGNYEQVPGLASTSEENYKSWFLEQS